ncbi:MAG: hypothetical protein CM15mP49_35150 [Actinomycetota bacterium]|nr:MAG: hypothetical protein CM15mP49_35150 [Actinomycetota bacterium]
MEVSSQPDIFSNEAGGIIVLNEAQIQSFIEGGSGSPLAQMKTIITMDPPEHRSYRKVASGYFTPEESRTLMKSSKVAQQQYLTSFQMKAKWISLKPLPKNIHFEC